MMSANPSIVIIGAGLAGVTCANKLAPYFSIDLFEQAARPAGRLAAPTQKSTMAEMGAPYFTIRHAAFSEYIASQHCAEQWEVEFGVFNQASEWVSEATPTSRWLGRNTMADLLAPLDGSINAHFTHGVDKFYRQHDSWVVESKGRKYGPYQKVIFAVPAPIVKQLLVEVVGHNIAFADMLPCHACQFSLNENLTLPYSAFFISEPPLRIAIHNATKPNRSKNSWLLHTQHAWSSAHIDESTNDIQEAMVTSFEKICQQPLNITNIMTGLWPAAFAAKPLALDFQWNEELQIGVVGDWVADGRVEGAYLSGDGLANLLLES